MPSRARHRPFAMQEDLHAGQILTEGRRGDSEGSSPNMRAEKEETSVNALFGGCVRGNMISGERTYRVGCKDGGCLLMRVRSKARMR